MSNQAVTVEQVRESQEHFKKGSDLHGEQKYKEAIEEFKQGASINASDDGHLSTLAKKLKESSAKLVQESIAYMGCGAVHLSGMIAQLTDDEQDEVPVDKALMEIFQSWAE